MTRIKVTLTIFAMLLVLAADSVSAQETSPTPAAGEGIAPEFCQVEPRSLESLAAIIDRPAADGTDVRLPIRFAPGDGEPAGDVAISQVMAVVRELAACFNAGDWLRVYALFSDEGLRPALIPEDIESAASATPEPLAPEFRFVEPVVWDVRVQDDGRVTALVDFDGEIALITFVWDDEQERYLIDLYDDQITEEITPPAGE